MGLPCTGKFNHDLVYLACLMWSITFNPVLFAVWELGHGVCNGTIIKRRVSHIFSRSNEHLVSEYKCKPVV
jgi:hypothetical protein